MSLAELNSKEKRAERMRLLCIRNLRVSNYCKPLDLETSVDIEIGPDCDTGLEITGVKNISISIGNTYIDLENFKDDHGRTLPQILLEEHYKDLEELL